MPSKKNIKKVTKSLKKCNISSERSADLTFAESYDLNLLSKWPKNKTKVPAVFLHQPACIAKHARKLISMGIQIIIHCSNQYHTKIICQSFNDHKALIKYFDSNQLPYHTYGHPSKNKLKVVIRGLPNDIMLDKLKSELKLGAVPIIRVHKMHRRPDIKDDKVLILAVVPYDDKGKKILLLTHILGYEVKLEPPKIKAKQCHRCQLWSHTQRYCHGQIKCVKCAGDHLSKKCDRDSDKNPPVCANCKGDHTASYRECPSCPDSLIHRTSVLKKLNKQKFKISESDLQLNN